LKCLFSEGTIEGEIVQNPFVLVAALFVVLTTTPALVWATRWVLLRVDRDGHGGGRPTPPRPNHPAH